MENSIHISSQDEEFIVSFENCTLPPDRFHHKDHVRLSWLYLHCYEPIEALAKVSEGIKRFAAFHGKPDRYHETITWSYFFLIRERAERMGGSQGWEEFVGANEDLFDFKENILKRFYDEATLASDLARRTFVFPGRQAAAGG